MLCGALLSSHAVNLRFLFSINVGTPLANLDCGEQIIICFLSDSEEE